MNKVVVNREWFGISPEPRSCGTCHACCIYLGITELKKWTGQTCKHLDGQKPDARCSIYAKRPKACADYSCLWLAGFGSAELKPENSGILLTPYDANHDAGFGKSDKVAVTAIVFDKDKAKGIIDKAVAELLMLGVEIRVVYYHQHKALLYKDGNVYSCDLLPPDGYESLVFRAHSPPIAQYQLKEKIDD